MMKTNILRISVLAFFITGFFISGLRAESVNGQALPEAMTYVGAWELHDTDGSVFHVTLAEDGSAKSDWGPGEVGTWKMEGGKVTVSWTDGWHDVLYPDGEGFHKDGYAPGVPLTAQPTNSAPAHKLAKG